MKYIYENVLYVKVMYYFTEQATIFTDIFWMLMGWQ